jgi:hypothetical protein
MTSSTTELAAKAKQNAQQKPMQPYVTAPNGGSGQQFVDPEDIIEGENDGIVYLQSLVQSLAVKEQEKRVLEVQKL